MAKRLIGESSQAMNRKLFEAQLSALKAMVHKSRTWPMLIVSNFIAMCISRITNVFPRNKNSLETH